jgi:hypothetical protein
MEALMKYVAFSTLAVALATTAWAGEKAAPDRSAEAAQKVSFRGCPTASPDNGRIVVKSGGETYLLADAKPAVELKGMGISGSGVVASGASPEARALQDVKYRYTWKKCEESFAKK